MTHFEENSATKPSPDISLSSHNANAEAASSARERWLVFIFAAIVLLLDYVTKEIVRNNLPLNTYWAPFPGFEQFFRITHVTNTGVAFGLFQNANLIFALFATVISLGIIYFNQKLELGHRLLRVALGLQLGGALGNLSDRLTLGSVTDFLDFGPWPVFNIADMAVVAGVILMGYVILQEERSDRASELDQMQEISGAVKESTGQDDS